MARLNEFSANGVIICSALLPIRQPFGDVLEKVAQHQALVEPAVAEDVQAALKEREQPEHAAKAHQRASDVSAACPVSWRNGVTTSVMRRNRSAQSPVA